MKPTREELLDFIDTVALGNTEIDQLETIATDLLRKNAKYLQSIDPKRIA